MQKTNPRRKTTPPGAKGRVNSKTETTTTEVDTEIPSPAPSPQVVGVLLLGIIAVSFASIFIRWAAAPPLTVAFYRLLLASIFFWMTRGFSVMRHLRESRPAVIGLSALSGVALAVHFAAWITSLSMTSVSSSVVLVSTTPIWVAVGSRFILREVVRLPFVIALLIAVCGAALISGIDASAAGHESALGNMLALIGALAAAIYFLIGRRVQRKLDTWAYVTATYSAAAVVLFLWAVLAEAPFTRFSSKTYGLFILIALVPQVIGHTSFNWSLKHLTAAMVSVALLGEPVGATVLAFFLLDEQLGWQKMFAGALILAGVVLAGASQKSGKTKSIKMQSSDKQEKEE